jgi:hypothetical protein
MSQGRGVEHEENGVVGWPENSFTKTKYAAERVVKDLLKSSWDKSCKDYMSFRY